MTDTDVTNIHTPGEQEPSVLSRSRNSESMPFAGQLCVPRPSINQVIVWLVLAAVLIVLDRGMSAIEVSQYKRLAHGCSIVLGGPPWLVHTRHLFAVALFAACLIASGVLIRSVGFRMLDRLQPGHWIVLFVAINGILQWIARPFLSLGFAYPSTYDWAQRTYVTISWSSLLVAGALFAFAAVRLRDTKLWKALLALGSATVFIFFLPSLAIAFSVTTAFDYRRIYEWFAWCWPPILIVFGGAIAIVMDWRRQVIRDWLHWLGVSLCILAILTDLIMRLWVKL